MGQTRYCRRSELRDYTPQHNGEPSWPEIKVARHPAAQSLQPIAISTILRPGLTVDQRTKTMALLYVHSITTQRTMAVGLFESTTGLPSSNRPVGSIRPNHYYATPIGTPRLNQ